MKDVQRMVMDMEQPLMEIWNNTEAALDNAVWRVFDDMPDEDEMSNILMGIKTIHDLACQRFYALYNEVLNTVHQQRWMHGKTDDDNDNDI